jgi:hypothetical protein
MKDVDFLGIDNELIAYIEDRCASLCEVIRSSGIEISGMAVSARISEINEGIESLCKFRKSIADARLLAGNIVHNRKAK